MPTVEEWISEDKDYTDDVVELDEIKVTKITPQLKAELEKFTAAKRLSMVACDLKSFENFPLLEELEELDLTDNKIKGEELRNIPLMTQLRELCLSCNPINNIQDIKTLARFNKSLETLLLDESPLAKANKTYRKDIFQIIGGALRNVDLEDRQGKQIAQDSFNDDEDDDQDEEDDVQGDIIDDEEDEGDFQPKKQREVKGSGKKQADQENNDEDDDEDDDDDEDEGDFEEDDDDDEEEEASQPQKRIKRN